MMVVLWLAVAAALIGVVAYGMRLKRLRDTPEELRGDWWASFEADFRAYAQGCRPGSDIESRSRESRRARGRDLAEGNL